MSGGGGAGGGGREPRSIGCRRDMSGGSSKSASKSELACNILQLKKVYREGARGWYFLLEAV